MHRRLLLLALMVIVALGVSSSALAGGNSGNAKLCQKDGWRNLQSSDGHAFTSQSECVSYGSTGAAIRSPKLSANYDGCEVPGFVGFPIWALTASGFTPNSTGRISIGDFEAPLDFVITSAGFAVVLFIPDFAGLTLSATFTDANGVHAGVTFGPTTLCDT